MRQLGMKCLRVLGLAIILIAAGWAMTSNPVTTASAQDTSWGTKVINEAQTLSLQARGTEPGDTPETVQVNFDLCALQDTFIDDTQDMGNYNNTVDVVALPADGVLDGHDGKLGPGNSSENYSLPNVIIVDNTPMVNEILTEDTPSQSPSYGEAGDLVSVLHKGTCTTASVELKKVDRNRLVFGFVYTTIPFGEFRIGGGLTRLSEQGPTKFSYEYEVN